MTESLDPDAVELAHRIFDLARDGATSALATAEYFQRGEVLALLRR